jgi:hypothetical protein
MGNFCKVPDRPGSTPGLSAVLYPDMTQYVPRHDACTLMHIGACARCCKHMLGSVAIYELVRPA